MRLDFNVLWVDDQPAAVRAQGDRIGTLMTGEGFNFNARPCQSIDEVKLHIADDLFRDEVDLILVDWDLGGGVQGQEAISLIRQVAQYKDIVFYSAGTPASELRRLAQEAGLEGIYCATREELVEEVFGVFEALVKKVLDLDHTRGIVMGATSDIDNMVTTCLLLVESNLDDRGKEELLQKAKVRVQRKVKDLQKKGLALSGATNVGTILKAHEIFGSSESLRMLYRLLQRDASRSQWVVTIEAYLNEVVPKRNDLGHKVLTPEGRPETVVNIQGKEISIDSMRELRKKILDARADFRVLVNELRD